MDKYEIVFHRKTEKELRKIPAQDRNKIFKLFGKIENDQGLNQDGVGMGLVIIQKIVKQFGGTIGFESKYG